MCITAVLLICCLPGFTQYEYQKVVEEHFRVDPFRGSFSAFVNALSTDTALHDKKLLKQTDSTGYYLRGTYHIFNPFSINANKVEMFFAEMVNEAQRFSFYNYQIIAYFNSTETNLKAVKKDFEKLHRRFKRDLPEFKNTSLKDYNSNVTDGAIYAYKTPGFSVEPVTISWQTIASSKQIALTILLRLEQRGNAAIPPGGRGDDNVE